MRILLLGLLCLVCGANAQDKPLPTYYIIGDSISVGMYQHLQPMLAGKVNVIHSPKSTRDTAKGLGFIPGWFPPGTHYDIISLNFGLWDLAYRMKNRPGHAGRCSIRDGGKLKTDPATYEMNLSQIMDDIDGHADTIIWVDTTYIPLKGNCRKPGSEDVYNAIARKLATKHGYRVLHFDSKHQTRNGHFKDEGYEYLAKQMNVCIQSIINHSVNTTCPAATVAGNANR